MKKNAIVVAGIMCVAAGCATNQGQYQSSRPSSALSSGHPDVAMSRSTEMISRTPQGELVPPSDPSLSTQYDPAMATSGGFSGTTSGTSSSYSSDGNSRLSVDDFHADSSVRGGSSQARGFSDRLPMEQPSSDRMSPTIHADSSIRGGSNQARFSDHPSQRALSSSSAVQSSEEIGSDRDDFGQGRSSSWASDKAGSVRGSANWNASDDLLRDGVESGNDASISGAATSSSGSDSGLVSKPAGGDLNASPRLEQNISGHYDLEDRSHATSTASGESTLSVGGPGSNQTGSSTSSAEASPSDTSETSRLLFHNNRAHGVGSAATGESGTVFSEKLGSTGTSGDLGQRVKATLTRESTGAIGMMRQDVARNIQVTSHGSTVTLKGTVPSQKDKDMIEIRTREISGVSRVDNQLSVAPEADSTVRDLKTGHDLEDTTDQLQSVDRANE